MTPSGLLDN